MKEMTDFELCGKVAEIEGYETAKDNKNLEVIKLICKEGGING